MRIASITLGWQAGRQDAPVAITANASELVRLICTLVTRGEEYVERKIEVYEQRHVDRSVSKLGRRVNQLGYRLVRMIDVLDTENGTESMA